MLCFYKDCETFQSSRKELLVTSQLNQPSNLNARISPFAFVGFLLGIIFALILDFLWSLYLAYAISVGIQLFISIRQQILYRRSNMSPKDLLLSISDDWIRKHVLFGILLNSFSVGVALLGVVLHETLISTVLPFVFVAILILNGLSFYFTPKLYRYFVSKIKD